MTADSVLFDDAGEPYLADFALGPTDAAPAADDVRDFALSWIAALATTTGSDVADVAGRRASPRTVSRPGDGDFVPALVAALSDGEAAAVDGAGRTRTRACGRSTRADAADFFGRDALVDEVLARLRRRRARGRLVLVVGGSGTGKSSVVRAGLLPRVRRGEVPGSDAAGS